MQEWILNLMDSLGYAGVALLMFLENVFPPIPSELIMPLAGFTAASGKMSFWIVVAAGSAGSVIGQIPLYYLGRLLGKKRLMALADRYGVWLTVSGKEIERASDWFDKHGSLSVLICRMIPGLRSLISIPAGICEMNVGKFLLVSTIGITTWSAALAWAGKLLGEQYLLVEKYLKPVTYVVFAGLAIAVVVWVVQRRHRYKRSLSGGEAD